jgi:hypothetical protein
MGFKLTSIRDLIGTGGILALLLFVVGSLIIAVALGGRDLSVRSVMGLATAQRNVSAALVVSARTSPATTHSPACWSGPFSCF